MVRAWSLYRGAGPRPFSREAFAEALRMAWAEAKARPVTPLAVLRQFIGVRVAESRDEVVEKLAHALRLEEMRAAAQARRGASSHAYARLYASRDFGRRVGLRNLLAAERGLAA
ncbi:hypothetical protein [Phreatobacter stygius]|uniref:Uncharacterized protein n=1 Tax=Phreatobacter stygius TaxID=1940610 RepID=A0A4D7B6B4_9HYPH|nr:hypothetical protein [Phreatobacter stygius]QCI68844.1 hypothetical protein E8M01_34210 [Phreatobacter stygius]